MRACGVVLRSFAFCLVLFSQVQLPRAEGSAPTVVLDVELAVERQRLRFDLLQNYDRDRRGRTTVRVFYEVQHVLGLDEKGQILSVNGRLAQSWRDPLLSWDPERYSGVSFLRFSPREVWLPELQAAYNVRPLRMYDEARSPPVSVSSNGSVQWCPQVRFDVPCSADYRHYPFDSHRCSLRIVADALGSRDVVLDTRRPPTPSERVQGTEWALKDVVHTAEPVPRKRARHQVVVSMHLERTSRMYRYVCVLPTLVSMATLLCGFWVLSCETTRYVIGCANVVVLSMLLQHLAATVPAGRVLPIVAQYSASCLCLSAIFVVVTVANDQLRTAKGAPPAALVRWARRSPRCLFSGRDRIPEASSPDRQDWLLVSALVDRLTFWLFVFVFAVLLAVLAAV